MLSKVIVSLQQLSSGSSYRLRCQQLGCAVILTTNILASGVSMQTCTPDDTLAPSATGRTVTPACSPRWINAAPQYWVTPSLVPASLSDTLAAAACDEAVDLVLPQLRQAAQHTLQQLRPGALQVTGAGHAGVCLTWVYELGSEVQGQRACCGCINWSQISGQVKMAVHPTGSTTQATEPALLLGLYVMCSRGHRTSTDALHYVNNIALRCVPCLCWLCAGTA